ncbi:MAG: hypothetical protein QXO22_04235 [Thermosphaera sp.]
MYNWLVPITIWGSIITLMAAVLVMISHWNPITKIMTHVFMIIMTITAAFLLRPALLVKEEGYIIHAATSFTTVNETLIPRYVPTPYGDAAFMVMVLVSLVMGLMVLYESVELVMPVRYRGRGIRFYRRW